MSYTKLKEFSTCDIADALVKLGHKNFFIADLHILSKSTKDETVTKILGPAYTVKMVHKDDESEPRIPPNTHWLDSATKGTVVVISSPPGLFNAVFGGLMGARASFLGVEGVIVDGRVRDTAELNAQGLKVFARGKSSLGAGTYTRPSTINGPIAIPVSEHPNSPNSNSTVTIHPGDIVMADRDGTVIIPKDYIDQVAALCTTLVEIDNCCMKDILNGSSVKDAFNTHRN